MVAKVNVDKGTWWFPWARPGEAGKKSMGDAANRRSMMPKLEQTNLFLNNIGLSYFPLAGFPGGSVVREFKMGTRGANHQLWTGSEGLWQNLGFRSF
jgi:hypothetical protein